MVTMETIIHNTETGNNSCACVSLVKYPALEVMTVIYSVDVLRWFYYNKSSFTINAVASFFIRMQFL